MDKYFKNTKPKRSIEDELAELGVASEAQKLGIIKKTPFEIYLDKIIGGCSSIKRIKEKLRKINQSSNTTFPVLILGNTGTGKELIAQAIHGNSPGKFIGINAAGIPENLLESEIFGHVKGSFTGAFNDKVGLIEEAEGGTLFLDEIGDMPPMLQAKLLRAIQEKRVRRIGGTTEYKINCRIVSATNIDESLLRSGKTGFRKDLYFRLAGCVIHLPDLHERDNDWELITKHYLGLTPYEEIPTSLRTKLEHNRFTNNFDGNIRQLINLIDEWKIMEIE